ncbi:MAG: hypothetical protein AAF961_07130, partial [Planctomycetota bacterium]
AALDWTPKYCLCDRPQMRATPADVSNERGDIMGSDVESRRAEHDVGSSAPTVAVGLALLSLLIASSELSAQGTLVYSFEPDLEGFFGNGFGATTDQDEIGATEGVSSMRLEIVEGATFVGALTDDLAPEIGDPPGMDFVVFDLTILEEFPSEPGDFVDAGITIFGATQPDFPGGQQFGLQAQFLANQVPLGGLSVGTHEIRMDLAEAVHPVTFETGSFNDIFGVEGSDPDDMIPTGFQIYINKSSTAPWTGYFDNLRVGITGGPDFNQDGAVDGLDLPVWESAFGVDDGADADGDGISDGADFLIWQRQFDNSGSSLVVSIPEPSAFFLAALACMACRGAIRLRVRAAMDGDDT